MSEQSPQNDNTAVSAAAELGASCVKHAKNAAFLSGKWLSD